jgi:TM2 domain-containing membrane protein YozV
MTEKQSPTNPEKKQSERNPAGAAVLSFLVPGAGQAYNGDFKRGLLFLIGTIIGTLLLILPGIIVWGYGIYDAAITAKRMNEGTISVTSDASGLWKHLGLFLVIMIVLGAILIFGVMK